MKADRNMSQAKSSCEKKLFCQGMDENVITSVRNSNLIQLNDKVRQAGDQETYQSLLQLRTAILMSRKSHESKDMKYF